MAHQPPDWTRRERRMFATPKAPHPQDTDDFPMLNPRLFRTRDGRVWIERMTMRLFSVGLGVDATEARLRYAEAQRDLIREIERDIQTAEDKEADPTKA